MNLKKSLLVASILFATHISVAVAQAVTGTFVIDKNTVVYNASTGQRMDFETLSEIIRKNPQVALTDKINERGEVTAKVYHPNTTGPTTRDILARTKANQPFPNFIFTTTQGQELHAEELKGKIVVLYFNLYLKAPFATANTLSAVNNLPQKTPSGSQIFPIVLTHSTKEDAAEFSKQVPVAHPVVPSARNFMELFIVTELPSYVVINQDGTLRAYVQDAAELKKMLLKL